MRKSHRPGPGRREMLTVYLLIGEIILFWLFADNFFSATNLTTVIQNAAEIGCISIGVSMCIILGGTDLSVGSALGVCAVVGGSMLQSGVPSVLVILVTLAIGVVIGLLNGLIVTTFDIPPIIATLAVSNILRAVIFGLLGGRWLTGLPPILEPITKGTIGKVPVLLFVIILLYAVCYAIMMNTPFGRHVYAIGSNQNAAQNVGIRLKRTKMIAFTLSGLIVGFASLLYISRMGAVDMTVGSTLPIQCIAAVFLGGTSVKGRSGKGTLLGTLAGVFFIAFMKNGIVLLGIPSLLENAMVGAIIILSVLFDRFFCSGKKTASKKLEPAKGEGGAA